MSKENVCACKECVCTVSNNAIERDGKLYCCESCANAHSDGSEECGHNHCQCGK